MTRYSLLVLTFVSLFFLVNTSYSQVGKGMNEELAIQHARKIYITSLSDQAGIYNGPEYIGYPHRAQEGHPFFLSSDVQKGDIRYDGELYEAVPMWYDLARKEVVIQYADNFSKISLHKERVSDFSISGHHFINIQSDSVKSSLERGIYDQIYNGKSQVLVQRSKSFLKDTNTDGIRLNFSGEKANIFIRSGEIYKSVSSQKSVLNALGKFEKEILAHLKQGKIKFRNEREKAIILIAAYYDQLNSRI